MPHRSFASDLPDTPVGQNTRRDFLARSATGLLGLSAGGALANMGAPAAAGEVSEWLSVKDFGAKGDGVTDDGPALIRMRDYIRQDRSKPYKIFFPAGHYRYTNNRWLAHVGSVTLDAAGVKFQCIDAGASDANTRPLNTHSILQNFGDNPFPIGTYDVGKLFKSATRGASIIALVNLADVAKFSVNDRVILLGFDQQFQISYPPNMRYFEWKRITSISSATGALTFDTPLVHDYDANWPDFTYDATLGVVVGRPRVLSLDRPLFVYPRYVEIRGAEFLFNPSQPSDQTNGLVVAADTLVLRGCIHHGWTWPSENRKVLYEDCAFDGNFDGDKICDEVSLLRCTVRGVLEAFTGVNRLIIENCDIVGGYLNISPRRALVQNNRIRMPAGEPYGAIRSHYASWPVELLECYDNAITHDGSLLYAINNGFLKTFTVSAVGARNEILLANTAFYRDEVVRDLMPGFVVTNAAGTSRGSLTRIGWNGTQWVLEGTWQAPVQAGETWTFSNIKTLQERGTTFVGGVRPLVCCQP
jgi:hypothetical protein